MKREFEAIMDEAAQRGDVPAVVLDAAILLEVGWQNLCDRVIFVDSPRETRLDRVRSQRGWSAEILDAREQAQWPLDQKKQHADLVIMNDDGLQQLEQVVDRLWANLHPATTNRMSTRVSRIA